MVVRLPKQHGVLEMEVEDLIVSEEYGEYSSSSRTSDDGAVATALSFIKRKARVASLIFLAIVVGILLLQMDSTVTTDVMEESEDVQKKEIIATHGNSFGGINNIASPGGAKAAANMEGAAFADIIIPQSNVGHATPSLNRANILNLVGHYVHDEHRSPYSSHLYDKPQEFLDKQQDLYLAKMKRVREEWGAWGFQDPNKNGRQAPSFEGVPYKDLQRDQFPASSWQADEHYNAEFLKEAKALVKRMQHGIYAEYGWPLKDGMTQEELEEHSNLWKIHVDDDPEFGNYKQGIAVLSKVAMDGLVRKLLHAMMTHDEFYAVLGGHSAAAGHGNDFQQNRIMTFHRIMEPVFDKLGMRLVSRNMGMGGVGTLQFSLAGGDLYGEADILEWDSGMTEKGPPVDLFNKQAILSGERVPLIITSQHDDIKEETNGLAYMGKYIEDKSIFPQTTLENENEIPYAAQWYDEQHTKYNAICWEPRSDFEPPTNQKDSPGSQVGWHPGNRHHTWQGRKLALVVLHALSIALDTWETAIEEKGVPLEESYWHVGMRYAAIRDKLRRHLTTPKSNDVDQDVRSKCEAMMPWLPRVCRVQMHGFGMWTPRVLQDFDFLNLIHPAPNGYKPDYPIENVYHGFDLLPLNQALADDQVDVHAIAIATNNSPPDLDHSWTEGEEGQDSDGPANRRWLREASEKAMLWGPTLEAEERQKRRNIEVATHREQMLERELNEDDIVPGRGWEVHGWDPVIQFCDGSAQSECARTPNQECLLYGTNDKHMDVMGTSLSGWLVFTVPKVQEGIILIRMEWWCSMDHGPRMTDGWSEVNDGRTTDTTPWNATSDDGQRMLSITEPMGQPPLHPRQLKESFEQIVPEDLEMDYAINGTISTMAYEEWKKYTTESSKNVAVWPLLNDVNMAEKKWDGAPVEVAVRFRSQQKPHVPFCISHVYFA